MINTRVSPIRTAVAFFVVTLFLSGAVGVARAQGNQNLPQTINVPVTFYDFHSDRSNPEFEQPHMSGRITGMVAPTLDADFKPVAGPNAGVGRAMGVAHWFRDWAAYTGGTYGRGSNRAPSYNPPSRPLRMGYAESPNTGDNRWRNEYQLPVNFIGPMTVSHDTSFKNVIIRDNLTFTLTNRNTGMYQFEARAFFPLDRRGFGNEWLVERGNQYANPCQCALGASCRPNYNHNYAFTMEVEFPFVVQSGMEFNFRGDDDVWVFIDRNLVLDLGGIKDANDPATEAAASGSFTVAGLGLREGATHILRVFYAERHSTGSSILISTNIIAPPGSMDISTVGDNGGGIVSGQVDKPADQTLRLYSVVYDDNGVIMTDYNCEHVSWTIGGRPAGTGCYIDIADSLAGALNITVTYNDRANPPVTGATNMNVRALRPASIHIQRGSEPKPAEERLLSDDIYFRTGENTVEVYAVLRDRYGNFVDYADARAQVGEHGWWSDGGSSARWTSHDITIAGLTALLGRNTTVVREIQGEGTEDILTVEFRVCNHLDGCITISDTVAVGSRSASQISVGPPFIPGITRVEDPYTGEGRARILDFYKNVINRSGSGGLGVLIAVDAPTRLNPVPGTGTGSDAQYGRVVIYDAVGNVVRAAALYQAGRPSSYGYVWDGRNESGRIVGPGSYLVRVTGRDNDRNSFFVQRMVGVTK